MIFVCLLDCSASKALPSAAAHSKRVNVVDPISTALYCNVTVTFVRYDVAGKNENTVLLSAAAAPPPPS